MHLLSSLIFVGFLSFFFGLYISFWPVLPARGRSPLMHSVAQSCAHLARHPLMPEQRCNLALSPTLAPLPTPPPASTPSPSPSPSESPFVPYLLPPTPSGPFPLPLGYSIASPAWRRGQRRGQHLRLNRFRSRLWSPLSRL